MAFIDEIKIFAKAGDGGNGVIRWRQEKFIAKGGPAGGDGGRGGDVYIEAVRDIHILGQYRHKKEFEAPRGADGGSKSFHGANGEPLILKLPVGSVVVNQETGMEYSLIAEGQREKILKGGSGGKGNEHFKSSIHTTPKKQTDGRIGEQGNFTVELELFADIGLVGLPNAGKSSLLNMITNADAKVGDYAFTTLDPNLGDFYGYIIADIPGIIEGASEGKGLGTKFLRHIKRTKMLAHLISFDNENTKKGGMMKVYKEIRKELKKYGNDLDTKEEMIVLTKTDVVKDGPTKANTSEKQIEKKVKEFEKLGKTVFTLSLYDDASIKRLRDAWVKLLKAAEKK
jgi:GTP-binding protein